MKGMTGGFLTRDDFVDVYEKVASLLHASNPYGRTPDLAYFDQRIPTWGTQIARLLEKHLFVLAGSTSVYLVHMHEEDGRVHHYTLNAATPADLDAAAQS